MGAYQEESTRKDARSRTISGASRASVKASATRMTTPNQGRRRNLLTIRRRAVRPREIELWTADLVDDRALVDKVMAQPTKRRERRAAPEVLELVYMLTLIIILG